ncbi:hypothetical protein BURMUCF2_A2175 [Burkholderia multivorans CF2]|nr:hypothetical protein BURMUCF2_A2175 [Burkholderia multivorans CF2]
MKRRWREDASRVCRDGRQIARRYDAGARLKTNEFSNEYEAWVARPHGPVLSRAM